MKSINNLIKNEMIDISEQVDNLKESVEKQDVKMDMILELLMKDND